MSVVSQKKVLTVWDIVILPEKEIIIMIIPIHWQVMLAIYIFKAEYLWHRFPYKIESFLKSLIASIKLSVKSIKHKY